MGQRQGLLQEPSISTAWTRRASFHCSPAAVLQEALRVCSDFTAMCRGGPDDPHLVCGWNREVVICPVQSESQDSNPELTLSVGVAPFNNLQLRPRHPPGCSFGALTSGVPFLPRPSGLVLSNLYLLQNCLRKTFKTNCRFPEVQPPQILTAEGWDAEPRTLHS